MMNYDDFVAAIANGEDYLKRIAAALERANEIAAESNRTNAEHVERMRSHLESLPTAPRSGLFDSLARAIAGGAEGPGGHDPFAMHAGELDAMRREGLDPNKELGAMDPRALDPHCVHGISFTEDCPECNKPVQPIGGS